MLWELGAEVIPIGVTPDGFNINQACGSTATGPMREMIKAHGADLGIALDGDADRLILADEQGEVLDGDQLMALVARSWRDAGRLKGKGVVATVMSNLGLERHLTEIGIALLRTPVGDRYVVERMRAEGCNIGGEQSGHLILSDYTTTGDGLIAALQALAVIMPSGKPASEVGACLRSAASAPAQRADFERCGDPAAPGGTGGDRARASGGWAAADGCSSASPGPSR